MATIKLASKATLATITEIEPTSLNSKMDSLIQTQTAYYADELKSLRLKREAVESNLPNLQAQLKAKCLALGIPPEKYNELYEYLIKK